VDINMSIVLGFRGGGSTPKIEWVQPSFAPDHVDDAAVGSGEGSGEGVGSGAGEGVGAGNASGSRLRVELLFDEATFHTLCSAKGKGAAEAIRTVAEPLPGGYSTDRGEWDKRVHGGSAESLCGEVVCALPDVHGYKRCIRSTDLSNPETQAFVMRLTNAMMWLIDGCTPIDVGTDPTRWQLLTVWERDELVAAATVYIFVVPCKRLRVCQVFVVPRHQRQGVGAQLLDAIYAEAKKEGGAEVNVEDPCAAFSKLRDVVDARRAGTLRAHIDKSGGAMPSAAQLAQAQTELLLSKEQLQRLVELLRMRALEASGASAEAVTTFRVECKRRLLKVHNEDLQPLPTPERKRKLADMYEQLAGGYRECAQKLGKPAQADHYQLE